MFPWWVSWSLGWWITLIYTFTLVSFSDLNIHVEARGSRPYNHNHLLGFNSGNRGFSRGFFSGGGGRHYRGLSSFKNNNNKHFTAKITKPKLESNEVFLKKGPRLNGVVSPKGALGGGLKTLGSNELGMGGSAVEPHPHVNGQRFAFQPVPQTAVIGSTAVLPCR